MSAQYDLCEAVSMKAELGEGPTWNAAAGRLLWVDILTSTIHSFDPSTGSLDTVTTFQHVGAVKPRAAGGLVVNLRDGIGLYGPGHEFTWLHHLPVSGCRGNDAAVAPDGAFWAGTMRYDEAYAGGTLSRVDADGDRTVVLDDVTVSNGIGWSPEGDRMYYIDSPTKRIDVFRYDEGRISGRAVFVEIESGAGVPDGLTVDAAGAVWVALWDGGQVRRYTPEGVLDRVLPLPVRRPTACAFGGADLTDLYITTARVGLADPEPSAGSLYVIPGLGEGLPQAEFAG
ncbi:SMP-30/gluconolactonase/LRE family protein [Nocardia carnea]|uniref:SMP-30/gluconolactonase/LRE family protein n=1 Tax=Nocardia carnea TaxID=37328 RepID=UPI0024539C98|nr:SMP-30/gluconolactonase/LRE family protein [Nocardia carnea]